MLVVIASSVMVKELSLDLESIASTMYSTKLMPASVCSWFSSLRVRLKMMELIKSQPSRLLGRATGWNRCVRYFRTAAQTWLVWTRIGSSFIGYGAPLLRGRCGVLAPIAAKGLTRNLKLVRSSNG